MKNSEHIKDGEFQSDKYPDTPRGLIPFKATDPMAQDLLWEYAQRRRVVDAVFADDLETVLKRAGYEPAPATEREPLEALLERMVEEAGPADEKDVMGTWEWATWTWATELRKALTAAPVDGLDHLRYRCTVSRETCVINEHGTCAWHINKEGDMGKELTAVPASCCEHPESVHEDNCWICPPEKREHSYTAAPAAEHNFCVDCHDPMVDLDEHGVCAHCRRMGSTTTATPAERPYTVVDAQATVRRSGVTEPVRCRCGHRQDSHDKGGCVRCEGDGIEDYKHKFQPVEPAESGAAYGHFDIGTPLAEPESGG